MEAQIREIATGAITYLSNPVIVTMVVISILAIATGVAGRLAVVVEDLRYDRAHRLA